MNRAMAASLCVVLATAAAGGVARAEAQQAPGRPSACISCHAGLDGALAEPTTAWASDVHALAGLGCESCHGGDPAAPATDADAAMSPAKGFAPSPDRLKVPEFCARCHSDPAYMKQYNPQQRVDQYAEYRTSVHGRRNAAGDGSTATCTDCHGVHGILPVSSPQSPVYATQVPETCGRCHSDRARMAPYGIPTDQLDLYRASAHGAALLGRGDTSAPACNDCHGNHGAAPPGVKSVANVCGQCHGREGTLFRASFKNDLFQAMEKGECTVCHDHHLIRHPTPALFDSASAPQAHPGSVVGASPFAAQFGDLDVGSTAEASWIVVLEPHVPANDDRLIHHVEITAEGAEPLRLDATVRPDSPEQSFDRTAAGAGLEARLRIMPLSGQPVVSGDPVRLTLTVQARARVRAVGVRTTAGTGVIPHAGSVCLQCHSPGDDCDRATEKMSAALASLDRNLRDASALLHRAEIAGMEVSTPLFELKSKGTTAAVEARALIHTFDPDRILKRAAEGEELATAARASGLAALDELQFRRKGLAVSLVLIGAVLLALGLKIRQLDRQRVVSSEAVRTAEGGGR